MVITRRDWRINSDLLQWLAESYPGLPPDAFEAAFRLLSDPDVSDEGVDAVEVLLAGCVQDAASGAVAVSVGQAAREPTNALERQIAPQTRPTPAWQRCRCRWAEEGRG